MLKAILLSCVFVSITAGAEVFQIDIGNHQNLQAGDVAVVNSRGQSSTIVCMGGNGGKLPVRKRYQATVFVPYEKWTVDTYPFQTLQMNCQRYASLQEPKQAIAMAVAQARENCFEDYNRCAPPYPEAEQYFFNFVGHGRVGCEVTAFMIGTEPNR